MDNRLALALKHYDAGFLDEAWLLLKEVVAEPSPGINALRFAAMLRLEACAFDDVIAFCDRIGDAPALLLKAHALYRLDRLAESESVLRTAIAQQEFNPPAWNDLGNVLDDLGRGEEAAAAFARAIQQSPQYSPAHNNLGAHLAGEGRFVAAANAHQQALDADPANVAAALNLGVALLEQGRIAEAEVAFDGVLKQDPSNLDAADNRLYARLYAETDPRVIFAAHAAWGQQAAPASAVAPLEPTPRRRLRVGYVSPDFRRHSVSFFVEPLLVAHDPAAVEIFCYADVPRPDVVTERLKAAAHHWRDTHALPHNALRQMILDDHIDVLVDLAGHTKGNRLPVFAFRAAPVQVTALGYPATTGLPAMDYRLCDAETDPMPDTDMYATEKLIRLPTGLHCYAPSPASPAVAPLPALASRHITFGSFNKLAKISPRTVALWSAALHAVPGSCLVLKSKALTDAETRDKIVSAFTAHGISSSRLELLSWMGDDAAHLGLYNRIDIALDTFPYNGTTTTCEALWMGVPVLTFAGTGHVARVGASLLSRIGLKDWVCHTPEMFAARAAMSTQDLEELAILRSGLRALMTASPLFDAPGYARAIEDAYRAMWRRTIGSSAD